FLHEGVGGSGRGGRGGGGRGGGGARRAVVRAVGGRGLGQRRRAGGGGGRPGRGRGLAPVGQVSLGRGGGGPRAGQSAPGAEEPGERVHRGLGRRGATPGLGEEGRVVGAR